MTALRPFPPDLTTALRAARHVAVLTGAGISAESGIPTFRDAQHGLWARYRPEDLATPEAFRRNPRLVWEWYAWRRDLVSAAEPNDGHRALAAMQRCVALTLITQNVDGLHQRAGSTDVIELHGNITRIKCSADGRIVSDWPEGSEIPPPCPACGAPLRPDVVWFGESLPQEALEAAHRAAVTCDVFLSVGTSNAVVPAASLPWIAAESGAPVGVVNPTMEGQRAGPGIHLLAGSAGRVLPQLLREIWSDVPF